MIILVVFLDLHVRVCVVLVARSPVKDILWVLTSIVMAKVLRLIVGKLFPANI